MTKLIIDREITSAGANQKNPVCPPLALAVATLMLGLLTARAQFGGGAELVDQDGKVANAAGFQPKIVFRAPDYNSPGNKSKATAWLGLSFDESSGAVASQLGLKRGQGLTVNFVASNSPASNADFRTNDVLAELDGQMLVHPEQLRKLIQVRKEGDTIKFMFYRGGEKQTKSVKLGKTTDTTTKLSGIAGSDDLGDFGRGIFRDSYILRKNGGPGKEVTWFGVGVEETSNDEALSSQLGLKPGEGLTISLVSSSSPAAQSGLHTNDVLVELDGQMLVHPAQFSKLVQLHDEGDAVKVEYYRGGKKQTATVKLGKTTEKEASVEEGLHSPGLFNRPLFMSGAFNNLGDALSHAGGEQEKAQYEVKRAMDQAQKALQDAMRQLGTNEKSLSTMQKKFELLNRDGLNLSTDATVTVSTKSGADRTIMQTDENGTLLIKAGDKMRLTARDKSGKVLFDGNVDTTDEKEKVPKEIWVKAKPLVEQAGSAAPAGKTLRDGADNSIQQ